MTPERLRELATIADRVSNEQPRYTRTVDDLAAAADALRAYAALLEAKAPPEATVVRLHPSTAKLSRVSEAAERLVAEVKASGQWHLMASVDGFIVQVVEPFTESEQAGKSEQPVEPRAVMYEWLCQHPDEFASAVGDAYGQWNGEGDFAALMEQEIAYQKGKPSVTKSETP